jgi:hypothetical protein
MPADTSNTERIRHKKAKIQATGSDSPTDESTRLSRQFGQQAYYRQQGNGAVLEESCCSPTMSTPGVSGSRSNFTITWKQTVSDLPTITSYTSNVYSFIPGPITVDQAGNGSCIIELYVNPHPTNVVITLTLLGYSLQFTLVDVQCIDENVYIQTMRGPVKARDVCMDDQFLQLDGTSSKVTEIICSPCSEPMYAIGPCLFTHWHPVRMPNESVYVVAGAHPLLKKVPAASRTVYNFRLESEEHDILFAEHTILAESLNDLPHGQALVRT